MKNPYDICVESAEDTEAIKENKREARKFIICEIAMYVVLALTIIGQIVIPASILIGQSVWLVSNIIAVSRDFVLHRPPSDKIKDACMLAITAGIIAAYLLGWY